MDEDDDGHQVDCEDDDDDADLYSFIEQTRQENQKRYAWHNT